jgi:hypothetical protein
MLLLLRYKTKKHKKKFKKEKKWRKAHEQEEKKTHEQQLDMKLVLCWVMLKKHFSTHESLKFDLHMSSFKTLQKNSNEWMLYSLTNNQGFT